MLLLYTFKFFIIIFLSREIMVIQFKLIYEKKKKGKKYTE
jgi:hypothetical protein